MLVGNYFKKILRLTPPPEEIVVRVAAPEVEPGVDSQTVEDFFEAFVRFAGNLLVVSLSAAEKQSLVLVLLCDEVFFAYVGKKIYCGKK